MQSERDLSFLIGRLTVNPGPTAGVGTVLTEIADPRRPAKLGDCHTGACPYNRPCAQQYVGKSQSCMVISGRLLVHART